MQTYLQRSASVKFALLYRPYDDLGNVAMASFQIPVECELLN